MSEPIDLTSDPATWPEPHPTPLADIQAIKDRARQQYAAFLASLGPADRAYVEEVVVPSIAATMGIIPAPPE